MNKNVKAVLVMGLLGAVQANASIMACKPGPICNKLHQAENEVKTSKSKRHKDVQEYGRLSAEVKADDRLIASAAQGDREIRAERKSENKKPSPGKHRRRSPKSPIGPKSA